MVRFYFIPILVMSVSSVSFMHYLVVHASSLLTHIWSLPEEGCESSLDQTAPPRK